MKFARVPLLVLGLGLFLAWEAARAAGPAAPIPVRDFVRREEFWNPVLSPDGRHVALNRRIQVDGRDVTVLVVHHLPDLEPVSTVRLPAFELPLSHQWLTATRLAVNIGFERGSIEKPVSNGEIMAMDVDGGRQKYLFGYRAQRRSWEVEGDSGWASILQVPAARDGHVLLTENLYGLGAEHSRVWDMDSVTLARRLVTEIRQQDFDFLFDGDGKPRFAIGGDAQLLLSVWRYDEATEQWQELTGADRSNLRPLAFAPDGKSFVGLASRDGGPRELVRQSVADGRRTLVASDPVGSIEALEWTPPPRQVPFAAWTEVGLPKVSYLDPSRDEAKLHQALSAQFPGERVRFLNFTDDGGKLLFEVASDRNPGDYFLFDRARAKADLLFSASSWLDPDRMAPSRPIRFKASDGLELHGYLTLPRQAGEAKPPLVLLPHGGPHGVEDGWAYDPDAQFLASRGYAVLQLNFRGSSGRGQVFTAAGYGAWGTRIQDDLIEGVRWLQARGEVDPRRACIVGASFGAYSAMMAPSRAPGLFQCAVGYAGLYDLAMWLDRDEIKSSPRARAATLRVIGKDPAQWAAQSPTRVADRITLPVLLVHGGDDRRTPPDQARAMREALTKAGHPPEWLYVDGEGHGFYAEKNRQVYYERLETFLAKHLAPRPSGEARPVP